MSRDHRLRDTAITAISAYFCGQSFYIVFKMWTHLSFNDKVNAMESVFLTLLMLCEALDILYFYKFDESKSALFMGELYGLQRRIDYKHCERAIIRGKRIIEDTMKKRVKIYKNCRKFVVVKDCKENPQNNLLLRKDGDRNTEDQQRLGVVDRFSGLRASKCSVVDNGRVDGSTKKLELISGVNLREGGDSRNKMSTKIIKKFPHDDSFREKFKSFGSSRQCREFFYTRSICLIEEILSENLEYSRITLGTLRVISGSFLIIPVYSIVRYLTGRIEFQELHLAFLVYLPFTKNSSPDNIVQFIAVTFVQGLYLYLFNELSTDLLMVELLSYTTLKTEIKLFVNNLEEFDVLFCTKNWSNQGDMSSLETRLKNLTIWQKFGEIVAHHQVIFRKYKTFTQMVALNAIYINGTICLELCVGLFLLQGELYYKVKYTVISLCLWLILALYSEEGQDIEDGFEEMRDALCRISWHNMSVNLRKSFTILLTRHNLPTKISGAHGIFIINRKNLSRIMRASYSYFNILNHIK